MESLRLLALFSMASSLNWTSRSRAVSTSSRAAISSARLWAAVTLCSAKRPAIGSYPRVSLTQVCGRRFSAHLARNKGRLVPGIDLVEQMQIIEYDVLLDFRGKRNGLTVAINLDWRSCHDSSPVMRVPTRFSRFAAMALSCPVETSQWFAEVLRHDSVWVVSWRKRSERGVGTS